MTGRAPRVSGRDVRHALERDGWRAVRQSGSHVQMTYPTKPGRVTVPMHGNTILTPKTLAAIVQQAGMTMDELRGLL